MKVVNGSLALSLKEVGNYCPNNPAKYHPASNLVGLCDLPSVRCTLYHHDSGGSIPQSLCVTGFARASLNDKRRHESSSHRPRTVGQADITSSFDSIPSAMLPPAQVCCCVMPGRSLCPASCLGSAMMCSQDKLCGCP